MKTINEAPHNIKMMKCTSSDPFRPERTCDDTRRVLFLAHRLPFPVDSGGARKRLEVVRYLAGRYELGVAVVCPAQDLRHKEAFLSAIGPVHFHAVAVDRPRNTANFIRSCLGGLPLSIYRNYLPSFKSHVQETAGDYDVLYLDSLLVFPYLPSDFSGKVVLHAHNAEYFVWERYAATERNLLRKGVLRFEMNRLKRYERLACRRADWVLAASPDRFFLSRLGAPSEKLLETFHFGDQSQLALDDIQFSETDEALLYVGSLDWEPNLDGLIWFLNEAWDGLKAVHPKLKFYIVGRNPGQRLSEAACRQTDVVLTGFVDDLEPYHRRCRLFVAPLRFGGGMKVKIVNAMYRGIPVVTTPVGAEGLESEDMRHLLVRDSITGMTEGIGLLLGDGALWERLRDESRRHAREHFGWDRVYAPLRRAVEQ